MQRFWQVLRLFKEFLLTLQSSFDITRPNTEPYTVLLWFLVVCLLYPEADSCWYKLVGPYLVSEGRITNTVVGYGTIWLCTVAPVKSPPPFCFSCSFLLFLATLYRRSGIDIFYLTGYGSITTIFSLVLLYYKTEVGTSDRIPIAIGLRKHLLENRTNIAINRI